jgi:SIR2-like domain
MGMKSAPRVILYLGAGASHFAGYYTFVNFPELLFNADLRRSEHMPDLSPNSERILKAIRLSLERNNKPTTHDNFLWRLDGYTQLLRLNQSDDVLQEFLRENTRLFDLHICTEQAIHQISASTIHHYSSNQVQKAREAGQLTYENMRSVLALYRQIAMFNGQDAVLPVFTTNYDMLLEDLVDEFGCPEDIRVSLSNGIPGRQKELMAWRSQEYNHRSDEAYKLYLYRLHGCVCWFYHDQGDSNIYFHRRDATQQQIDKLYAMYPGREARVGLGPHGHSFRTFYQHLQVCDLVVFVGFSFRDDDVMHVLLKALSERRGKLKLLVADRLYTTADIKMKLEDASHRTTFPFRLPKDNEIISLNMKFGTDVGFDARILECCQTMLARN